MFLTAFRYLVFIASNQHFCKTNSIENKEESLKSKVSQAEDGISGLKDKIEGLDQHFSTSFGESNDPFTGVT